MPLTKDVIIKVLSSGIAAMDCGDIFAPARISGSSNSERADGYHLNFKKCEP